MVPDYVLCADCESPCYVFEWLEGRVKEAVCEICGNEDPLSFMTQEDYDEYASSGDWRERAK